MSLLSWSHGIKVSFVPHYCLPDGVVVFDTDANHLRKEQLRNNGLILYQLQCGLGEGQQMDHQKYIPGNAKYFTIIQNVVQMHT